jgi:hypothetical protein
MLLITKKIYLSKVKIVVAVVPSVELMAKNIFIKKILISPKRTKASLIQ